MQLIVQVNSQRENQSESVAIIKKNKTKQNKTKSRWSAKKKCRVHEGFRIVLKNRIVAINPCKLCGFVLRAISRRAAAKLDKHLFIKWYAIDSTVNSREEPK